MDDDVPTVKKVAYGEVPAFDGTPVKASTDQYDYTFKSWDKDLVAVTGPATYTAIFDESLREYTITFIVNGASSTVEVPYGTIPTFDGSLDVAGKLFQSWDKDIVAVTGPATYTAVFVDDVPAQNGVASYNLSEVLDLVIALNHTNATLSSLSYGGKTLNSDYYAFDADADTITIKNDLVKSLFLTANEESTIKASFTLGENTLAADLKVKATKNEAAIGDNVALNSSIRITDLAMTADWTLNCNAFNRGKVGSPAYMTDGANNMWEALGTNEIGADKAAGGLGYFIFDLGQEYFLSTIKYIGYHDWWMGGNYVKVASKADYSDAVSMQFVPGGLQADSQTDQIISLDIKYRCRYILVTNDKENSGSLSAMTGLQAYVGDESSYSNVGRNVAPLADVKVKSMDMSEDVAVSSINSSSTARSADLGHITNGDFDMWFALATQSGTEAWFVLDLRQSYYISTIKFSFYHDWWCDYDQVQVASSADFSDAKNVYLSLSGVQSGEGLTADVYDDCRYIRITNHHSRDVVTLETVVTDVQAFVGDKTLGIPAGAKVSTNASYKFLASDLTTEAIAKPMDSGSYKNWHDMVNGDAGPAKSSVYLDDADGNHIVGYLAMDLGKNFNISKAEFNFWHDWTFTGVKLYVASAADFSDKKVVYSADSILSTDNTLTSATFDTVSARYVLLTAAGQGGFSCFSELDVYTGAVA